MSQTTSGSVSPVTRRDFLKTAAIASGGLVIAIALPACSRKPGAVQDVPTTYSMPNAWLRIGTDDSITLYCDRSEMGQGVYTALPMLIAEELGVSLDRVKIEFPLGGEAYINTFLGTQITGGSTSVREAWPKLRLAGAQAREMLVAAASTQWGVAAADCRVEDGTIVSSNGRTLSFGAVAEAAAKLPAPKDVKLKERSAYTVIGKARRRLDTPAKVDGTAQYGIDVVLPGMLHAALAQPPVLGGKLKSFDGTKAQAMPGVKAVMQTSTGVAVVADSWWHAFKARDAVVIEWEAGPNASLDNAAVLAGLKAAAPGAGKVARKDGDAEAAIKGAAKVVTAEYRLPLLAHSTLEPQNCTADVRADGCDLYVPTQVQMIARDVAAKVAGLEPSKVNVHTTFLGGGFGRRLEVDFIPAAVEVSKALGKPVKLLWTREDDMAHDAYRPPALDTATGAFDKDGKLVAWKLHLVSPSITARMFPSAVEKDVDAFAVEAAANYPYDVPNVLVDFLQHEIGINVGYWRSVSHALNCFVAESFMDELAHAAGKDPIEFRLALLSKQPRYAKVLELAREKSGYGNAPKGRFHGVALMEGYGTYMAQVAEISMDHGKVRVHRITCALDCGQVVNPDTVVAQVEGGTAFGLTAALWDEITLKGGRVQQGNFNTYRLMRIHEMPRVDTYVVDSGEAPGGIGEPATAVVGPAVANAIFAATGRRLRSLPISSHGLA